MRVSFRVYLCFVVLMYENRSFYHTLMYIYRGKCFVLSCRISDNKLCFEVKWKHYKENTWEYVENLIDCDESLNEFWDNIDNLWYSWLCEKIGESRSLNDLNRAPLYVWDGTIVMLSSGLVTVDLWRYDIDDIYEIKIRCHGCYTVIFQKEEPNLKTK